MKLKRSNVLKGIVSCWFCFFIWRTFSNCVLRSWISTAKIICKTEADACGLAVSTFVGGGTFSAVFCFHKISVIFKCCDNYKVICLEFITYIYVQQILHTTNTIVPHKNIVKSANIKENNKSSSGFLWSTYQNNTKIMSCNSYEVFNDNSMVQPIGGGLLDNSTEHEVGMGFMHIHSFQAFMALSMNLANHILIMAVTLPMVYRCYLMNFEKTALHAHLCTIGFVLLMAEGVMVRYRSNAFFADFSPESKTLIHALLQFIGGFLGIIGTLQKYWGKEVHFKSRHGKFGAAACILCFINFVAGFWVLILPSTRVTASLLHSTLGVLTFVVGMMAQIYGYDTGFFRRNFTNKRLWKFATFVILVVSVIGPFKMIAHKIQTTFF